MLVVSYALAVVLVDGDATGNALIVGDENNGVFVRGNAYPIEVAGIDEGLVNLDECLIATRRYPACFLTEVRTNA